MTQDRVRKILAFAELKRCSVEPEYTKLKALIVEGESSEPSLEYELLRFLVNQNTVCPFELGYELGEYCMNDSANLSYAKDIMSQPNIAGGLLAAYQFIKDYFTFSRFEFSFSGYYINIRSQLVQFDGEPITNQALRYFILGRNIGMLCAINRASMFGKDLSIVSIGVDLPYAESIRNWARELDCELKFDESLQITSIDSRRLSLRHFLMNQVLQQFANVSKELDPKKISKTSQSIPDQVLALFHEQGSYELSKDQVASSLNLSTRTLGRRLQEQGTSWRKLVSEFRIDKAKQLLSTQTLSLQQVADSVGFSSLSAFSSAFSKSEGISPSEFIRRQSNKALSNG